MLPELIGLIKVENCDVRPVESSNEILMATNSLATLGIGVTEKLFLVKSLIPKGFVVLYSGIEYETFIALLISLPLLTKYVLIRDSSPTNGYLLERSSKYETDD